MKPVAFGSEAQAVAAWASEYRKLSKYSEYAAFIYTIPGNGNIAYYTGRTYKGMKNGLKCIRQYILVFWSW